MTRLLEIPVLLGTVRRGRASERVAHWVHDCLSSREGVRTELIDVGRLDLRSDDAGEAIKIPAFSETVRTADGLLIVSPEYNHGYPGMLKHALDSNYAEYVHKPAGVVGVSSGVFGGARMIENLLPVLRTVGLAIIPFDLYVAKAGADFQPDERLEGRLGIFLDELIWMARTLRHGREHIPLRP